MASPSWLLCILALLGWSHLLPGLCDICNLIFVRLLNHHNFEQAFEVDDEEQVRYDELTRDLIWCGRLVLTELDQACFQDGFILKI